MVPIISGLCTIIGVLSGWIVSARTSRTKREKALSQGVLALLRTQLVDAYESYVVHCDRLTVERRHEIDMSYEAYKALGGNGTITRLYEEICEVPTYIVGEGES